MDRSWLLTTLLRNTTVDLGAVTHRYQTGVAVAAAGGDITDFMAMTGLSDAQACPVWQWCVDTVNRRRAELGFDIPGLLAVVRTQPWHGAAGGSDVAVLEAVLGLMWRYGRVPVAAATAEVAVGAAVSVSTARRSLRRLVADRWLVLNAAPTSRLASEYVPGPLLVTLTSRGVPSSFRGPGVLGTDVARRGAAGKSALRVWQAVADGETTTTGVASRLGVASGTVRRHLGTLSRLGLVRREGRVWVALHDLEAAAWRAGTAGASLRQLQMLTARRDVRWTTGS